MKDKDVTAIAGAENPVENTNISMAEYANRRLNGMLGQTPKQEEQKPKDEEQPVEPEAEGETEEEEDGAEPEAESKEEPQAEDVLSKLDLDSLSEEELRELADKFGSRAVARFGELTAKRKQAEEELARLKEQLKEKKDPLASEPKKEDNPFKSIDSIEGLREKAKEVNDIIEWAEDVLDNSDEYGSNDIVTEIEGNSLTKGEVRRALKNARKSRDKFLPAQLEIVQRIQHATQMKEQFQELARQQLEWMDKEDNDLQVQYKAALNDPRFQRLEEIVAKEDPEVSAQLRYIIAHATNSIYGRKLINDKPSTPATKPPVMPNSSAAQPARVDSKSSKAIKETRSRFRESGSVNDLIALRTKQLSRQ